MSVIRVNKNNNYSVINNQFLNDDKLSWKAKGIMAWLLSRPDNWQIYMGDLETRSIDGIDSVRSGINELIKLGYISRKKVKNDKGLFSGWEYMVFETPTTDNPITDIPTLENPTTDNPTLISTEETKYLSKLSTKENKKPNFDFSGFDDVEIIAINKWFQYKKERKQNYTATGLKGLRNLLIDLKTKKQLEISINKSIANNWAGLFEDKIITQVTKKSAHDLSNQPKTRAEIEKALGITINDDEKPF